MVGLLGLLMLLKVSWGGCEVTVVAKFLSTKRLSNFIRARAAFMGEAEVKHHQLANL